MGNVIVWSKHCLKDGKGRVKGRVVFWWREVSSWMPSILKIIGEKVMNGDNIH